MDNYGYYVPAVFVGHSGIIRQNFTDSILSHFTGYSGYKFPERANVALLSSHIPQFCNAGHIRSVFEV